MLSTTILSNLIPSAILLVTSFFIPNNLTTNDMNILAEFEEAINGDIDCQWNNETYLHETQKECWEACHTCHDILYLRISNGYRYASSQCETQACRDEAWALYTENHERYVEIRNGCIDRCNSIY